ncbi:unnamed protein product [Dibothriocephalus latus]|uniref:BTB domain-containing protein n=1 Tax=Dibothriocephalus latus TaxID=60516 RepID=A0A3P7N4M9_DIBLA|nr:unnamed protein product [Dibothriocephalus latus]
MAHQKTQTFEDELPLARSLPELDDLRMAGKLTDLTIELQDNALLHAHRVVLASRVPSLCDTLCGTTTKGQTEVLKWPKFSSEVATAFVDYIYRGQLKVNEANAVGLIMLSQELEIRQVEAWSVSFMACRLNSENIANNWALAQLLKSDMLSAACLNYMKWTFEVTVASNLFIQLPSDALLSLLWADDLQVDSEETVLNAIGRWVSPLGEVDETRLLHAEAMMRHVRWNQINVEILHRLRDDDKGFWNKNVGCSERGTSQKLMDVMPGLDLAFAASKNCIFVIVGYEQDGNYTYVDKFDTREHRWAECAPLAEWLEKHAAVAVSVGEETVICVCGGRNNKYMYIDACALYSPQEDR